jgi:hypothetical protein
MIHYTHLKESPVPLLSTVLGTNHAIFTVVACPDTKYGRAISVIPSGNANADIAIYINAGDDAFYVATAIAHVHRHNLDLQNKALLAAYRIALHQKQADDQIVDDENR